MAATSIRPDLSKRLNCADSVCSQLDIALHWTYSSDEPAESLLGRKREANGGQIMAIIRRPTRADARHFQAARRIE
jgi:hypothetical protein